MFLWACKTPCCIYLTQLQIKCRERWLWICKHLYRGASCRAVWCFWRSVRSIKTDPSSILRHSRRLRRIPDSAYKDSCFNWLCDCTFYRLQCWLDVGNYCSTFLFFSFFLRPIHCYCLYKVGYLLSLVISPLRNYLPMMTQQ